MVETELKAQFRECSTALPDYQKAIDMISELIGGLHVKYQNDRCARMIIGSLKELLYDYYHHAAGPNTWCFDIDSIEHRRGKGVVAIIERKTTNRDIPDTRKMVMKKIADLFQVSAWLVNYDFQLSSFTVFQMNDDLSWKYIGDFLDEEYREWLNEL